MLVGGVICSILMGASLPIFATLLGTIIDAFSNGDMSPLTASQDRENQPYFS